MKKLSIVALLLTAVSALFASITHITTSDLQKMVASEASLVIVDARTPEYFKGEVIRGAKWLPYDSTEEAIIKALPSKDAQIVVYCFSATCPASGRLAERLVKMGYKNVSEYTPGIQEWKAQNLPVENY